MKRKRSAVMTRLVLPIALASFLFSVGKPVLVAGAAGGGKLPRCSTEGYGLEFRPLPNTADSQQGVRLTVGWLTAMENRRPCLLRTTIRLTIAGTNGVTIHAKWSVNSVRRPWSGIVHTWEWRNWCDTGSEPRVKVSAPGERTVGQRVPDPPVCESSDAPSTVTDVGTGVKYAPRSDQIPPHILPSGSAPPIHWSVINPKNAWLVSDGYTLVAVYAGSPGGDPALGRFAVIRQNEIFGVQYDPPELIDVGRVGAVKITRAPHGASRETKAQRGHLAFVAADGTKGVLDLATDRVRIGARR